MSRGVALSRLKDLCAAEGYPPIDSAKAHNVVNCMVAAGLLGKREAYVKDGRDRGDEHLCGVPSRATRRRTRRRRRRRRGRRAWTTTASSPFWPRRYDRR